MRQVLSAGIILMLTIPLWAQWEIYTPWQMEGAFITDLDTIRCGGAKMLIATTTKGIFLNPTETAVPATWIDISGDLAGHSVQSVAVKDSLIFVADEEGGVYVSQLSATSIPACMPDAWIEWNNGLSSYQVQELVVQDSLLIAATSNGLLYQVVRIPTTATLEQAVTTNIWQAADTSHTPFLLSLAALPQGVFAGSKLEGGFYYDPRCFGTTNTQCVLYNVTPNTLLPLSIYAVTALQEPDLIYHYPPDYTLQARGFLIGTGEGRNLYFCPVLYDSLFILPQLWVDISPSRYNPQWFWQVLSVLPVRIDSTQLAILVGTRFGGVLLTTDGGLTWMPANQTQDSTQGLAGTQVRKLFQLNDSTVIAVLDGGGLARSPAIGFIKTTALMAIPTAVDEEPYQSNAPAVWLADGLLRVQFPHFAAQPWSVALYTVTGQLVQQWSVTGDRWSHPVGFLPPGTYFCIVQQGQQRWTTVVGQW